MPGAGLGRIAQPPPPYPLLLLLEAAEGATGGRWGAGVGAVPLPPLGELQVEEGRVGGRVTALLHP